MNWGKVIYIFFILMSATSIVDYLYTGSQISLFIAASVNFISTILKLGVRNLLAAEMLASSLVADLHLVPGMYAQFFAGNITSAEGFLLGALIANIFSIILVFIECAKNQEEGEY